MRPSITKKVIYFGFILAVVTLACGVSFGLPNVNLPFVPTKTGTPLPANTSTPTPTFPPKLESSSEEYDLEILKNDFTVFTDKALGFRLTFPAEWLVVPLDEQLTADLFDAMEKDVPEELLDLLVTARQKAGIRVLALDYTMLYSPEPDNAANINVTYQKDLTVLDLEMQDLLDQSVEAMPTMIPEADVNYQTIQTNSHGVEYAKMIVNYPASAFGVPLRQVLVMVKLGDGVLVVTETVQEEMYTEAENSLQRVIDSLEILE